ncbi:MAG: exopolysaccharide biosynthesis polyprenyl glycosylphosphotransferase [Alphaproteobacteria bacterium]|nr:exopolysaccharide biosynthesis polyprenyl glycosylphosphotransferase [Alphaproteobacteria bacterium]
MFLSQAEEAVTSESLFVSTRGNAGPFTFPDFQERQRVSGRWILFADIAALFFSYLVGAFFALRFDALSMGPWPQGFFSLFQTALEFGVVGVGVLLWLDCCGHYRQRLPYWETVGQVLAAASFGVFVSWAIVFAVHGDALPSMGMGCWAFFAFFVLANRSVVRRYLRRTGQWALPAIIVGEGPTAGAALRALSCDRHIGFTILDQLPASILASMQKVQTWKQMLWLHDAQHVFLALEGGDIERYQPALKALVRAHVPYSVLSPWFGLPSGTMTLHRFVMHDVMMLRNANRAGLPLSRLVKRSLDVLLSCVALFALFPVFAVLALIIRSDGGPVLFKQLRVGRGGRLFLCYKFRSMRPDAEAFLKRYLVENPKVAEEWRQFQKLKKDIRVTKIGRLIRRISFDELPQLINVLKGDMSFVGPRPCLPGQENLYAEAFSSYESVRPGITGPWQVSGRNKLTFKERVALDAWYAHNWSVWLDVVILLKTIPTIFQKDAAF